MFVLVVWKSHPARSRWFVSTAEKHALIWLAAAMSLQAGAPPQLLPRDAITPLKTKGSVHPFPSFRSSQSEMPSPSLSAPGTQAWHVPPQPSSLPGTPQLGKQQLVPQGEVGVPQLSVENVGQIREFQHTPLLVDMPKRSPIPKAQALPVGQSPSVPHSVNPGLGIAPHEKV